MNVHIKFHHLYWTTPLWWAEVRKALKRLPLSLLFCISVNMLNVTVLDLATNFFENVFFITMGKKVFFSFFEIFVLDVLRSFFRFFQQKKSSLSLVFVLATSQPTYKYNFWHVCSIWNFHFWWFFYNFIDFFHLLHTFCQKCCAFRT